MDRAKHIKSLLVDNEECKPGKIVCSNGRPCAVGFFESNKFVPPQIGQDAACTKKRTRLKRRLAHSSKLVLAVPKIDR